MKEKARFQAHGGLRLVVVIAGLVGVAIGVTALARVLPWAALDSSALPAGLTRLHASESWRFGVGVPLEARATLRWLDALGAGWYLNWTADPGTRALAGAEFWPMVRFTASGPRPSLEEIRRLAARRPGAHWLIGNEPDTEAQDNATPEQYAEFYQAVYAALKSADPTCQAGPGGLAQVSPLRLAYLDRVLAHYLLIYSRPLPADFWGVHLYILREERDSWGAGIPPGLGDARGWLVEVSDHAQVEKVQEQVWSFRRWMKANGYGGRPLIVSEYGLLLPADYGFPPEVVSGFMRQTFDFFRQAADPELGDPEDGGRLVQRWAWFALAYPRYPTGDLANTSTKTLTPAGWAYRAYVAALP